MAASWAFMFPVMPLIEMKDAVRPGASGVIVAGASSSSGTTRSTTRGQRITTWKVVRFLRKLAAGGEAVFQGKEILRDRACRCAGTTSGLLSVL